MKPTPPVKVGSNCVNKDDEADEGRIVSSRHNQIQK